MDSGLAQQQSPPIRQMIDPVTMRSGHNLGPRLGSVPGTARSNRSVFGMASQGYPDYSQYQPAPPMMSPSLTTPLPAPPTPHGYYNPPRVLNSQGQHLMPSGVPRYYHMPLQHQTYAIANGYPIIAAPHQGVNTRYIYSSVPGSSPQLTYTNMSNDRQGFGGQTYANYPFNMGPRTGPGGMM